MPILRHLVIGQLFALLFLYLLSCSDQRLLRDDPRTKACLSERVAILDAVPIDILVVVDNSSSMAEEQALITEAFPEMLHSLMTGQDESGQRIHTPVMDLHVGVISTDMGSGGYPVETCDDPLDGDDGVLLHAPGADGCAPAYPDYLSYDVQWGSPPDMNLIDGLSEDFGCLVRVGTDGCGFEQPLEATRKALVEQSGPGGANRGFLRSDSILTILFVTDEDDCSVADATIFDPGSFSNIDLQCYYNRAKLQTLERYIRDFKGLRGDPDGETPTSLVVGMLVGVPPDDPVCNGPGDALAGCLERQEMQEVLEGDFLRPACAYPRGCRSGEDCDVEASPARRLVELAQGLGDHAVVQSICGEDFSPALGALTVKLRETINHETYYRSLPMVKDASDPSGCRCIASCRLFEELSDDRPCSGLQRPVDSDRDTIPDISVDLEGEKHTLCEIPQAGSVLDDCGLDCDDFEAQHAKDPFEEGWWYNPYADPDQDGWTKPMILLGDYRPQEGSGLSIHCCWNACGESRACGPADRQGSKCCHEEEYCAHPDDNMAMEGFCLVRRDICEEYGDDLWCPGAGLPGLDPLIGGLCCLDPEGDGVLDMADGDGDGFLDTPLYRCEAGACVPRL